MIGRDFVPNLSGEHTSRRKGGGVQFQSCGVFVHSPNYVLNTYANVANTLKSGG